jgi:hypothetical protein
MSTKKKDAIERVAEQLAGKLDDKKERCAALIEAINCTGAREAGRTVPLETILTYAAGFYGWMTLDTVAETRTVH